MSSTVSEQIENGSLVGLKFTHQNPEVEKRLKLWIEAYGRGPFRVSVRIEGIYVVLRQTTGDQEIIHFGSVESPLFNIGYVEPWVS